jgi:hypothetical protein
VLLLLLGLKRQWMLLRRPVCWSRRLRCLKYRLEVRLRRYQKVARLTTIEILMRPYWTRCWASHSANQKVRYCILAVPTKRLLIEKILRCMLEPHWEML